MSYLTAESLVLDHDLAMFNLSGFGGVVCVWKNF